MEATISDAPDAKKRPRNRLLMKGISMNVLVLGIVSLLTDMSSEMIYPILPLFLTSIGATALVIGLIEGAAETTASFLKVVSGWYSDRFGKRKPFISGGYAASTVVKPVLYLATAPWQVLGLRILERIGKGVRSAPRDALIADSTPLEYRGIAFGFHKAMDSTGAVIGPILILPVLLAAATVTTDTYRLIFLLSTIPSLVAVAVILLFVREKEAESERKMGKFLGEMTRLGKPFYILIAIAMTFYIGEISTAFFVLKAYEAEIALGSFDPTVSTTILYILFNVIFVLVAIPAGKLSDTAGRKPVVSLSFVLFILTGLAMIMANSLAPLILGFVLLGGYKGCSEGVLKAYVTDVAPKHLRGTALGAFHTCVGLVMLPGGVIAGLLWVSVGSWATFTYGIAMTLTALLILTSIGPSGKH